MKHFCWDKGKTLWMGSKDTREVKAVVIKDAFRRNDANTRIDYQSSQYAAVMAAFTERAAESLAASMIFDTSPKTAW